MSTFESAIRQLALGKPRTAIKLLSSLAKDLDTANLSVENQDTLIFLA